MWCPEGTRRPSGAPARVAFASPGGSPAPNRPAHLGVISCPSCVVKPEARGALRIPGRTYGPGWQIHCLHPNLHLAPPTPSSRKYIWEGQCGLDGEGSRSSSRSWGSARHRAPPHPPPPGAPACGPLLPAPTPTTRHRLLVACPTSTSVNQLPHQPRVLETTARMPLPAPPAPPVPPRGSRTSPAMPQSLRGPTQPGPGRRDEPWEDTVGGKRCQDQEAYMVLSVYLHVWGLGEQKGVLRDADPSSAIRASAPGPDVGSSHPARHRSLEAAGRARAGPGRRGGPAAGGPCAVWLQGVPLIPGRVSLGTLLTGACCTVPRQGAVSPGGSWKAGGGSGTGTEWHQTMAP